MGIGMVVLNIAQGSQAWQCARLGIPTASNFKRIITAAGTRSNAAWRYMHELVDEWQSGERCAIGQSEWMRRGLEMEPQARACYASQTGATVAQVGLVYRDRRRLIAASPDGLVGDDGLLEIKCPKPSNQAAYLRARKVPREYVPQVQGQLWVTGRKWCDFFSYHPGYKALLLRIYRDEDYIAKLSAAVEDFVAAMLAMRKSEMP